jgi:hypothetical protein
MQSQLKTAAYHPDKSTAARQPDSTIRKTRTRQVPQTAGMGPYQEQCGDVRRISTHRELFDWLARRLPDATPKVRASTYFINEALDVLESFADLRFERDSWTLHYFFHNTFRQQFEEKEQCSEALLWFLSQAYTLAAAEGGLRVPLETANQIAINALNLNNGYVRIRKGVIRSTKRCRSEFGISIRVALENEPYVVILL